MSWHRRERRVKVLLAAEGWFFLLVSIVALVRSEESGFNVHDDITDDKRRIICDVCRLNFPFGSE